jgi:D-apiose dehydrogenase
MHFDLAARYQECFSHAIDQFVDGVRHSTPFESDRLDIMKTLELVDTCYQAANVHTT